MSTERFDLRAMTVEEFLKATNCGYAEQSFIAFARQYPTMQAVWDALAEGHGEPWWFMWLVTRPSLISKKDLRSIACRIVLAVGDGETPWTLLTDEKSRRAVEVAKRLAVGCASDEELDAAFASAGASIAIAWSTKAAIMTAGSAKATAGEAAWYAVWHAAMEQHRQFFASISNPFGEQRDK